MCNAEIMNDDIREQILKNIDFLYHFPRSYQVSFF